MRAQNPELTHAAPVLLGSTRKTRLTSFGEIELRGPVGALAVVHGVHVAGVLVGPRVQSDAVSLEGLQRLCVFKI